MYNIKRKFCFTLVICFILAAQTGLIFADFNAEYVDFPIYSSYNEFKLEQELNINSFSNPTPRKVASLSPLFLDQAILRK